MESPAVLAMKEDRHDTGTCITDELGGKGRPRRFDGLPSTEFSGGRDKSRGENQYGDVGCHGFTGAAPHRDIVFYGGLAGREVHW